MVAIKRLLPAALVAVLCISHLEASIGKEAATLHLPAPSARYAAKHDPLVAEAAIRLAAIELSRRYEVSTQYWPADRPCKAYPRVELDFRPLPPLKYLRLERKGNVVTSWASPDGKEYYLIGRSTPDLPARVVVGVVLFSPWDGKSVRAVVTDLQLDGQTSVDWQQGQLNGPAGQATIHQEGQAWTFQDSGQKPSDAAGNRGAMIFTHKEGDFQLLATVAEVTGESSVKCIGPVCCDQLQPAHSLAVTMFSGEKNQHYAVLSPARGDLFAADNTLHTVSAAFVPDAQTRRPLDQVTVSVASWDQLTEAANRLADIIVEGLTAEMQLQPKTPSSSAPSTRPAGLVLNEACEMIATAHPGRILAATTRIDRLLRDQPFSAEAHHAASMYGAVLACQDLQGYFHERGRFLACPLAHHLAAVRAAGPESHRAMLASAWLQLACGYPVQAERSLGQLGQDLPDDPQVRALRMFITRDYRLVDPNDIPHATPLEQLGWLWATQQCKRSDLLGEIPGQIVEQVHLPSLLPLHRHIGVEMGHEYTVMAVAYAYARDSFDLLTCEQIPLETRRAIAEEMTGALQIRFPSTKPADDPEGVLAAARAIAWHVASSGEINSSAIASLDKLYRAAVDAVPCSALDCLSLRDVAKEQRALFVKMLFERACFLVTQLGAPDAARDYCLEVAEGLAADQDLQRYFTMLSENCIHKPPGEDYAALGKSQFGRLPSVVHTIVYRWPDHIVRKEPYSKQVQFLPGRGCWDWTLLARTTGPLRTRRVLFLIYTQAACNADLWNSDAVRNFIWHSQDLAPALELLPRMPYDAYLFSTLSYRAGVLHQSEVMKTAAERLIELKPQEPDGYIRLADYYIKRLDRPNAIKTALKAAENCEFSVRLSNLEGDLAIWLVAENNPVEALRWGALASRSGSARGLEGYAAALAANNRLKEATEVLRGTAFRYEGMIARYIQFLVTQPGGEGKLLSEVKSLLDEHGNMPATVAQQVELGLWRAGRPDLLEGMYEHPFDSIPAPQRLRALIEASVYGRKFDSTLRYAEELAAIEPLREEELFYAHLAARLTRNPKEQEIAAKLQAVKRRYDWYVRYIQSGQSPQEALKDYPAYKYWMAGVEAEMHGDLAGAAEYYRRVADMQLDVFQDHFAACWARLLGEQAQTQPAPLPRPTQPPRPTSLPVTKDSAYPPAAATQDEEAPPEDAP